MALKILDGVELYFVGHISMQDFHRRMYKSEDGKISYVVDEPTPQGRRKGLRKVSCYYYGTKPCRNIEILKRTIKVGSVKIND